MNIASIRKYFPSFLSRYSIQMMLIALPWVLERRHVSGLDISLHLAVFYAASLLALTVSGRWMEGWNLSRTLRVLMLILGIASAAALLCDSLIIILILRGVQGLASGLMRPLNQIWLIQMAYKKATHTERAQQAAMSQVFIGCGTMFGAFFGARIGAAEVNPYLSGLACALPAILGALLTPPSSHKLAVAHNAGSRSHAAISGLHAILRDKRLLGVILVYLTNMSVFKLWTVAYPMQVRSLGNANGPDLTLVLTVSPLLFLAGQFVMARMPRLMSSANNAWRLLLGSALLQAVTLPVAILNSDSLFGGAIVCLVGGFAAAAIYPAMQFLIMTYQRSSGDLVKNGVQLWTSAASDIGQMAGALILGFGSREVNAVAFMYFVASGIVGIMAFSGFKKQQALANKMRQSKLPQTLNL